MLRFYDGTNFFEMNVTREEDQSLPYYGDAYIVCKLSSHGFQGQNDLWVAGECLREFYEGLKILEQKRHGEAILESLSPNELQVRIHSVGSRGHMAVSGCIGYLIYQDNSSFWHSVEFGFEFEPSQLIEAVHMPWVVQGS